jgi:cysteine-rich repeat protein
VSVSGGPFAEVSAGAELVATRNDAALGQVEVAIWRAIPAEQVTKLGSSLATEPNNGSGYLLATGDALIYRPQGAASPTMAVWPLEVDPFEQPPFETSIQCGAGHINGTIVVDATLYALPSGSSSVCTVPFNVANNPPLGVDAVPRVELPSGSIPSWIDHDTLTDRLFITTLGGVFRSDRINPPTSLDPFLSEADPRRLSVNDVGLFYNAKGGNPAVQTLAFVRRNELMDATPTQVLLSIQGPRAADPLAFDTDASLLYAVVSPGNTVVAMTFGPEAGPTGQVVAMVKVPDTVLSISAKNPDSVFFVSETKLYRWPKPKCSVTSTCGDGCRSNSEGCDDGNLVNGDGCDDNCTVSCGNRTVTDDEECDDGNLLDGDGCDANCTLTGCGNAIVTSGDECDDGNAVNGDGCDVNCTPTGCGNDIVTFGEECDDGNTSAGDGCSRTCQFQK